MRIAAVQFDIAWEDKPANHRTIERMLDEADVEPGTFVLLPELGDTGFSFDLDVIVDEKSLTWATRLAAERQIWVQAGYARRAEDGFGRNVAAIVSPDGELAGTYEKVHPFGYGKLRESEYFRGGDHLLLRRCDDLAVCPLVCYDLRFPELWRLAAIEGGELFTIGASWPDARQHHWRSLLIARAIENQAFVAAVNRVGDDPQTSYSGGSILVSPSGEILAEAGDEPVVLQAELDPAAVREWREAFPALRDLHRSLLGSIRVDSTI